MFGLFASFLFILTFSDLHGYSVSKKPSDIKLTDRNIHNMNKTGKNITAHLKYKHVIAMCQNRDSICRSNESNVCTMRYFNDKQDFKDFENNCFLFLSNMCDFPGAEYYIVDSGTCAQYLSARRNVDNSLNITDILRNNNNNVTKGKVTTTTKVASTSSKLYSVDRVHYDNHPCPYSCPDHYIPVCVNVNRGFGMHFKYYVFVNHCTADMYYCKHPEEFAPLAPGQRQRIKVSNGLGWSTCGSYKYLQFSRFSEVISSMGHYGWLAGDHRYSHIMEPHQRIPGYG